MGAQRKIALVLGGAACVHGDIANWRLLGTEDVVVAVNNIGRDMEGVADAWCTMHPEKMQEWINDRRKALRPDHKTLWRPRHRQGPNSLVMQAAPSWGGGSGLLGVTVALLSFEATHCVLVGIPMTAEGKHYDCQRLWTEAPRYHHAWNRYLPHLKGRVRSMSGWTSQLLGLPDENWLARPL